MTREELNQLNQDIVECTACPRLRGWCEQVAQVKRASFADQTYWGKPVPNLGDPDADLLIVGLAPAAHGANRTGRMFTGDRSGDWLFQALYNVGLASQPTSLDRNDGLTLSSVMITAVNHCAPPDNKPTPQEVQFCRPFLQRLLDSRPWKGVMCLGGIAWGEVHRNFGIRPIPKFAHGARSENPVPILGCYHPSQQNTFTGRLTRSMLDEQMQTFADLRTSR